MLHPSNPTMTADGRVASVFVLAEVLKDCKAKFGLSAPISSGIGGHLAGTSPDSALVFMAPWAPAMEEIVINAARSQTSTAIDQLQRVRCTAYHVNVLLCAEHLGLLRSPRNPFLASSCLVLFPLIAACTPTDPSKLAETWLF
jgi:hypothetical protein